MKVANNVILYDMFHNHVNTNKYIDKNGKITHFPNLSSASKAKYLNKIIEEYPVISKIPGGAISSNANGLVLVDIKKQLLSQTKNKEKLDKPVEEMEPRYYSKSHPRRSYTYQERLNKINIKNKNVLYIKLNKIDVVKVRGWNNKLKFDCSCECDFEEYIKLNPQKQISVTIEKDNCDDYWIVFKMSNIYKPIQENKERKDIGIDVGIKDIVTTSEGKKYCNMHFKKKEKDHIKALNQRISRRYGYANKEFRDMRKENKELYPSKRYLRTQKKISKLHRKIAWKRNTYNHHITSDIVFNNKFIGVETLNVSGMFRNKHLANALSDAAMGVILQMIKYKAEWYQKISQPISRWTPSSKECNCCGEINSNLKLSDRSWFCPRCKTLHDRDINASKNILKYALQEYEESKLKLVS